MQTATSTTLLDGLKENGNEAAWRRFYARYTPMLLSYAKRVGLSDADAQDAVAATLTTFLVSYRQGRYDRSRARLKSWLGGIVQNKVLRVRARKRLVSLDNSPHEGDRLVEPAIADDLDGAFEREWKLDLLNRALEKLRRESDPTTYQAFDLYALKNWPVKKVASFLNMTANAVYIAKTRSLDRLQRIVRQLRAAEETAQWPAPTNED